MDGNVPSWKGVEDVLMGWAVFMRVYVRAAALTLGGVVEILDIYFYNCGRSVIDGKGGCNVDAHWCHLCRWGTEPKSQEFFYR